MRNLKKPKASMKSPPEGVKAGKQEEVGKKFLTFSFTDFHGESVSIKNKFNNFYKNEEMARKGAYSFIGTLAKISRYSLQDILHDRGVQDVLSYHAIEDEEQVELIKLVLAKRYGFSAEKIKEMEGTYEQFGMEQGGRVVCTRVGATFGVLFVDCNHMIYGRASKNLAEKFSFCHQSFLAKVERVKPREVIETERHHIKLMRDIVQDIRNGKYEDSDKIAADLEVLADILADEE